jgi:hypothetical protein
MRAIEAGRGPITSSMSTTPLAGQLRRCDRRDPPWSARLPTPDMMGGGEMVAGSPRQPDEHRIGELVVAPDDAECPGIVSPKRPRHHCRFHGFDDNHGSQGSRAAPCRSCPCRTSASAPIHRNVCSRIRQPKRRTSGVSRPLDCSPSTWDSGLQVVRYQRTAPAEPEPSEYRNPPGRCRWRNPAFSPRGRPARPLPVSLLGCLAGQDGAATSKGGLESRGSSSPIRIGVQPSGWDAVLEDGGEEGVGGAHDPRGVRNRAGPPQPTHRRVRVVSGAMVVMSLASAARSPGWVPTGARPSGLVRGFRCEPLVGRGLRSPLEPGHRAAARVAPPAGRVLRARSAGGV